ncbi:MAG: ParB/RepB/Spo0J family partition protein [Tepidisphaeraceae bacterium]
MSNPKDPKQKSRLGRGLSSLMGMTGPVADVPVEPVYADVPGPVAPGPAPVAEGVPAELPIDLVRPNPHQPRRQFDDAALAELAASIKTNGVIQPIVVKKVGPDYELIAGERRLRAAKLAGLTTVPAVVRDADRWSQAQMALVENIQRTDLNPIDRAHGYRTLLADLGLTQAELAIRLGEDRSTVSNHLRLLELDDAVQDLVRDGKLSLGHAKVLAGVTDKTEQIKLAELVVGQDLSVRNLERILTSAATPPTPAPEKPAGSAHVKDLETSLTRQIGLRVQLKTAAKKGKGKLVIHYNNLDEFDTLVGRLGVKLDD